MIITIHLILAIILFLIQNWIGERAYARGYIKFSLLDEKDEAISSNFVIKVFGPTVFLIITVATLQYFHLNQYVSNIINVIYFYLVLRLFVIIVFERLLIVNWFRIILYYTLILWLASLIYNQFITKIKDLLPDFSQIKNEIWLLIIVFIYQIGNRIEPVQNSFESNSVYLPELKKRKKKYILRKHDEFLKIYGENIDKVCGNNPQLKQVVLAIILFENFNRPRLIRFVERIYLKLVNKPTSIGIMQITSSETLTDIQSVDLGSKSLCDIYVNLTSKPDSYFNFSSVIKVQCPDYQYIRQVLFILKVIIENKYPTEKESTYEQLYKDIKSEFGLWS